MKRFLSLLLLGLLSAYATLALPNLVKVRVRVILVDQELSQKPVPFFLVSPKCGAKAAEVKTSLERTAEAQLPPGRCTVSSSKPAELGGKRFSWNIQVALSGGEQNIDLTNDNAKVEETLAPASPAKAPTNDLTEHFKRLKNTVLTVRSESGHGTGFFVDAKGLILTNQHVVGIFEARKTHLNINRVNPKAPTNARTPIRSSILPGTLIAKTMRVSLWNASP